MCWLSFFHHYFDGTSKHWNTLCRFRKDLKHRNNEQDLSSPPMIHKNCRFPKDIIYRNNEQDIWSLTVAYEKYRFLKKDIKYQVNEQDLSSPPMLHKSYFRKSLTVKFYIDILIKKPAPTTWDYLESSNNQKSLGVICNNTQTLWKIQYLGRI